MLVGHVTKDGSIAGPRVLEHLVDVVLHFEGDRHSPLRMVRGVKNRFGPADEVGCFELRDEGIVGMADPTGLFLARHGGQPVPGTCVTVVLEGRRPLLGRGAGAGRRHGHPPSPRRATSAGWTRRGWRWCWRCWSGAPASRLHDADVYAATVGGVRITEPAADLAVAMAVASARRDVALPSDWWCSARSAWPARCAGWPGVERRLAEAARLGFTRALVPPDSGVKRSDLRVQEVGDVALVLDNLR